MKYRILLGLFTIIIIISAILTFVPLEQACKSTTNSCSIVQTSEYEKTLGIENSHIGLIAFTILFILTLSQIKKPTKIKKILITIGTIGGTVFSIYFLYIQFFILNATCPYCLIADTATILSLLTSIFIKEKS
jgi:uncharacterized membrane protein